MQQDNIENKLQQLENQRLPDLSQMDAHWKNMEALLPDVAAGKTVPSFQKKAIGFFAAMAILSILFFAGKSFFHSTSEKNNEMSKRPAVIPAENKIPDSVKKDAVEKTVAEKEKINSLRQKNIAQIFPEDDTLIRDKPVTINFYPCDTCAKISTANFPDSLHEAYLKMLAQKEESSKQAITNFYNEIQKPVQTFIIDNRFDTILVCDEGTVLKIPAAAFAKTDDKISIEVKEYYSYADMILNKLNTSSDGKQLISDGMISVKAMQNGKEIELSGTKTVGLEMPRRDLNKDMQFFTGEISPVNNDNKKINWVAQGQYQQYEGDDKGPDKSWEPYSEKKRWYNNKMVRKYLLPGRDSMTKTAAKQLIRKENPGEDFIIKIKRGYGTFSGNRGKLRILPYRKNNVLYGKTQTGNFFSISNVRLIDKGVRSLDSIVFRYSFTLKNTGWINCDRFYNDPTLKIQFSVNSSSDTKIYMTYLVFDGIRSVMTNYESGDQSFFYNIPEGKNATLICLGTENGKTVYAMKKIVTAKGIISDIQFEETTPAQFKQKIAALDL
ncbi:MAG: hypothetical protein ABJA78_04230 [Ferruginibacter sp.]